MTLQKLLFAAAVSTGMFIIGCADNPVSVAQNDVATNAAALPDLDITSFSYVSNVGGKLTYTITIKNQGTATTPNLYNVVLQNYLSTNTIIGDADDKAAGGTKLGKNITLKPGESFSFTYYTYESNWSSSYKYLVPVIDNSNIINESNENNNTYFKLILPDVIVSSLVITSMTSTTINYTATIKNDGYTTIPDIYEIIAQTYESGDAVYGNSDDVASGGTKMLVHKSLGSKATHTFTFSAPKKSGKKYLIMVIDNSNEVMEIKEANNVKIIPIP